MREGGGAAEGERGGPGGGGREQGGEERGEQEKTFLKEICLSRDDAKNHTSHR